MDSDQGKLFIGGISWDTDEAKLHDHFSFYGEVLTTIIMKDKVTGRPRGFGFVVFADPAVLDKVLQDKHVIDGRTVEAKRALSRDEHHTSVRSGDGGGARNFGSGGNIRTKKIFVGGLPATITEDGFREYFEAYGSVTDVVVMFDQQTQRPRGFGFISFDSEDAVDRVLHKTFHDLNGKQVEVKRALPKDANSGGGGRSMGGAGTGGGGYQGYGASGGGSGSYDNRMDTNRYMQPQNTGAGFQGYGSSGYGAAGYGYGPGNNTGFGSYGGYGGPNPGGYGPPTGAAYGNPNVPSGGYGGGPQASSRSTGYGTVGYGNAAAPWGGPNAGLGSGGLGSSVSGQSPGGGASGYGNQAYGYGGVDGSYANQAPYGAVGGRAGGVSNSNVPAGGVDGQGGGGGGYMGGGYGDANGNSAYGNQGWRSDSSQASANYGGAVGYGGGYGAPARQVQ